MSSLREETTAWSLTQHILVEWISQWMNEWRARQINIIMSQLNTELNTGYHRSEKTRAGWGRQGEETRESFPLPLGRTGNGSHEATQYKKNISFISTLDFMLLWRVSYVCANKLCGLMWTMHLRNNVCDDVSMPRCDSCHALVPADLAFTPPWALGNSCQLCSWSKTLGKERTGK